MMTDNRNTILAVILSGLVLIAWQYFYNVPQMERQRAQTKVQSELVKRLDVISMRPHSDYVLVGRRAALGRDFATLLDDLRSALHRLDRQGAPAHRNPGRDGRTRHDTRAE